MKHCTCEPVRDLACPRHGINAEAAKGDVRRQAALLHERADELRAEARRLDRKAASLVLDAAGVRP